MRIPRRGTDSRRAYLDHSHGVAARGPKRGVHSCSNLAHAFAACAHHFKVALVTDGRMSGASGKVPAAIPVTPEAADRGRLAKVKDGDVIRLDARLEVVVDDASWAWRTAAEPDLPRFACGLGREMFANFRANVSNADAGAPALSFLPEPQPHTRAAADARF